MRGREVLLEWYRPRDRAFPWRRTRDPYRILVSEVMLQQTQAARVAPAYRAFVRAFPTVRALATASRAAVLRAWGGLGYNRRAAALQDAARIVVRDHRGRVPADPAALRRLPGVGSYTAAAVASIAFGVPLPALDTNVRRVVARFRLGAEAGEVSQGRLGAEAAAWMEREDPASWNQALMDLGREVCRPLPRCEVCPLERGCRFRRADRRPIPSRRGQASFEGSFRQTRGRVLRALLERSEATLETLARDTGEARGRVARAAAALAADGLVRVGPKALAGRPRGRVRLAD